MKQTYDIYRETLLDETHTLTVGQWDDLGDEIETWGCHIITLYISIDMGDDYYPQAAILCKLARGATDEYYFPLETVAASAVTVEDHVYDLNTVADQLYKVEWQLNGTIPYVQFRVQVDKNGGAADTAIFHAYCIKYSYPEDARDRGATDGTAPL